jgi:hypothetical protein
MLPDLPDLKSDLQRVLERYVRAQVRQRMPGLGEAPQHQIHECVRMRIVRADGSIDFTELHGASAEARIPVGETEMMTPEDRPRRCSTNSRKTWRAKSPNTRLRRLIDRWMRLANRSTWVAARWTPKGSFRSLKSFTSTSTSDTVTGALLKPFLDLAQAQGYLRDDSVGVWGSRRQLDPLIDLFGAHDEHVLPLGEGKSF